MYRPKCAWLALGIVVLGGCSALPPPRPLEPGQVYYCCPGSAVPRRVTLPEGMALAGVKTSRYRTCGTF